MGQITTRKCSICKMTFSKEEIVTVGGKNYCPKCKKERDKKAQDYKDLMAYIDDLSDYDRTVMPIVARQILNLKQKDGITDEEILSTLKYMYELKEPPLDFRPEYGIANVPFFFREAQLFYRQNSLLASVSEKTIIDSINYEPIKVTIKRSDIIKQNEEYERERKKKEHREIINLDDLDLEEDEPFVDKVILNYKNKLEHRQKHKYDNKDGRDDDI